MSDTVKLLKDFIEVLTKLSAIVVASKAADAGFNESAHKRAPNGQFGSGGGGGGSKSSSSKSDSSASSFAGQMNKRTFRPTNAQMHELENTTKSVLGTTKVPSLGLTNVNINDGTAKLEKDGNTYEVKKLRSNGGWYLTGNYTSK